jgi:predicted O-methyltransferase YrrM
MLTRMVDARFAVEVGVFTGYSSLCIARALADDGRLLACDISLEWTAIAQEYWQRAGIADRVDLRIGPALDTLRALPADPVIDIAFIDADKGSYPAY